MADEGMLFIRVLKGGAPLAVVLVVTALMMGGYAAYEYYVPALSDVFVPFFKFFRIAVITYAVVAVHNACRSCGTAWRLIARTYVVVLVGAGMYVVKMNYGVAWAFAYPLLAIAATFITHE